jgi:modulator of FtsH protease HflC
MKNLAIPVLIAVIFAIMLLYLVSFQVRQTESVYITRFDKPVREVTTPGLGWKWPTPIEKVNRFDSRLRVLEAEPGETTTRGNVPIIVHTYIAWRVKEPLKFLTAFPGGTDDAVDKLRSQINDTQNRVIGQHAFGDFLNSDPNRIKFDAIQNEMLADIQKPVLDNYGIEVRTLGIKQLKISEDVTRKVFDRMKEDRRRLTEATVAQGAAEATRITSDADGKRTTLMAAAEGRAKQIQGQGDAEAARYYEMLNADPHLAMILREFEALRNTLKERATIMVPTDARPFRYLREMPSVTPAQPGESNPGVDTKK